MNTNKFMQVAIDLAFKGMRKNAGGPFGAVVVRKGLIVGRGYNRVLELNDPTKHAEMLAISDACRKLKRFDLSDCEIYATSRPCPMCLSAIMWARIFKVYFANDYKATSTIGFDDKPILNAILEKPSSIKIRLIKINTKESKKLYDEWQCKNDKQMY